MELIDPKTIEQLTGRKRYSKQIEWLTKNHIDYFVGFDGKPKVPANQKAFNKNDVAARRKKVEPNFDALG